MSGKSWVRTGKWRWPAASLFVVAVESWLLLTPELQMESPAFMALCALSCWMPAWFCADLLSTRTLRTAGRHEWTLREVVERTAVRLIPSLLVLGLWCGTFTYRSLREELALPTPRFLANIHEPNDLLPVCTAWTTVFLASGFAYGAGAGLCSALARRSRRWLFAPAVVVGASLALTLAIWGVACLRSSANEPLPFGNSSSPGDAVRQSVAVPNYVLGATWALLAARELSDHHRGVMEWVETLMPPGIAFFCWIATLLFLLLGSGAWLGIAWIARSRERRHPNTGARPEASEPREDESALLPA